MHSNQSTWKLLSHLIVVAVCLSGCGNNNGRIPVTGNVLFDGKPLETGFISFVGQQGYAVASGPIQSGSYQLNESPSQTGIAPGTYTVQIESWLVAPGTVLPDGSFSPGKSAIPNKYAAERSSGFTAVVDPQHHNFDFELSSK